MGKLPLLMRCACSSASSTGTMQATNSTRPMLSKVHGCSRAGRGERRAKQDACRGASAGVRKPSQDLTHAVQQSFADGFAYYDSGAELVAVLNPPESLGQILSACHLTLR